MRESVRTEKGIFSTSKNAEEKEEEIMRNLRTFRLLARHIVTVSEFFFFFFF